jgi:hypothetical protein
VQVEAGGSRIWAAAPEFAVAVGDRVVVPTTMPMANFESQTLGRTFDVVYFAQEISVLGQGEMTPVEQAVAETRARGPATPPEGVDLSGIEPAEGGLTVARVVGDAAALAGQQVALRGRVVKFTPNVMSRNWLHLQDGSGGDLTVTTDGQASVGDLVLVNGTVVTDQDFGFGYSYEVLVENATVTVE